MGDRLTSFNMAAQWGKVRTGIWEATPGTTISMKGETFEFCHILSGRCEISEDGGESSGSPPPQSLWLSGCGAARRVWCGFCARACPYWP